MANKSTTTNGHQARGKPFRKGKSGNPNGRPKGARTKPVELTVPQEIERLNERAIELVVLGETDAAVTAFEKMFVLSWGANGGRVDPGEARVSALEMVALVGRAIRIDAKRGGYDDSDAEFFQHVGWPADASWDQWRAHYAAGDDVDVSRHANDLMTFPPIVARFAELTAERAAQEQQA